jgi:hypothetical protein
MAKLEIDNHFKIFAGNLEQAMSKYDTVSDKGRLAHQRGQIRELVLLETELRETLITHPWGPGVYRDFVKFICDKRKNILAARPYFRERQEVFTRYISSALKKRNDKSLYRFRFNWSLVEFILHARKWHPNSKVAVLARRIAALRSEILEQNLPLAISQARIFWANTPKSHLSYMDIVQIQCQALLLAIDKFVPPNDKRMSDKASLLAFRNFRAVAIGIMARDRVNAYSETLVHFYPKDKAKIYRALKALRRQVGDVDYEKLAKQINEELDDDKCRTDAPEIASLIAAGSTVSADYNPDPEGETVVESFAAEDSNRPDQMFEDEQARRVMQFAISELSLFDQKLLRMKGVAL